MHFKAGYIVDAIAKVITDSKAKLDKHKPADQTNLDQINGLLQYVSSFDVEFSHEHKPDFKKLNPVLATINNVITRGLPTRAPLFLEELFSNIGLTEPNKDEFEFNFPNSINSLSYESIFELLHIIEPKLEIDRTNYGGNLGSEGEWKFLNTDLREFPYSKQILQSQRDFATINRNLGGGKSLDFSYEFPYLNSQNSYLKKKGVIFEYDGSHHKINSYKYYDAYRDDAADEEGFETLRQSSERVELDQLIIEQFEKDIFKILKKNFEKDIKEHLAEYSLLFIPPAVARVQKTILEFLLVHSELFKKEKIEIAIVERDLPCGAIAVKSLQDLFFNINGILEDKDKLPLPEISLTVFGNSKWVIDNKLHLQASVKDEIFFKQNKFDIIIDHAILRRSNIYKETDFQNDQSIKIRSSHFFDTKFGKARRVYCADLLHYKSLVKKIDDGTYIPVRQYESHINFFIQTIFRKVSFREGQLPIISRALQQKPVIGLLPTGGGKSLTYQLPTFLQPGLCLVVDPIKSLMEDQVRVLKQNWIDCCDFINSNLNREEKVKKLIDFRYGETMFLFISPERFVMQDFRNIIQTIDVSKFGLAFSYCVIDEVHCVSEWGHDFRSTYLMLGKNAQRFAKSKSEKAVSLIGLTATASFDVLADIERELQIQHNDVADAIIMIENTIRPELFFRVTDVTNKERMNELNRDFSNFGSNLQKLNDTALIEKSKKHHYENFNDAEIFNQNILFKNQSEELIDLSGKNQNDFYAIIFCPTKGNKRNGAGEITDKRGVPFVYEKLGSSSKGFFYASDEDETNQEIQDHFENFVTDKSKHIVCTKAFGMGIDKKDIRSTYHYYYSGSLESLVQEAGRSGRDKKISEANILISKDKYVKLDVYKFFSENKEHNLIQNRFTRKAIRQAFEKKWNEQARVFSDISFSTLDEAIKEIDLTDFSLLKRDGTKYNALTTASIDELRDKLKEKDGNNHYKFLVEKHYDRNIHDFFHELSFKGVDTEKSQFLNLLEVKEFQLIHGNMIDIEKQDTLANTFNNCKEETFQFIITATKLYPDSSEFICKLLGVNPKDEINPPYYTATFEEVVKRAYTWSHDFNDFLFLLDENSVKELSKISEEVKAELLFVYSRDRDTANDTGRLIYRMHSMGFLEDYLIDYNKNNLYSCTFRKFKTIDKYTNTIEKYLRRYLSENTAMENIATLKSRLVKPTLVENIIECLYFLSEFSYKEIASKRKRATDEIESILNTSITEPNYVADWFQQNLYIKEQIYFYFNAKYARIGFKINGKPFSLLDDYREHLMSKQEILDKYLKAFREDGTEQNNYKHMIGSCKKILRSLSETDLNNEWLLRLLKAFSMYSVNNASYISEANSELELGFDNLYKDESYHDNNFEIIEPIFESYFTKLQSNIQDDNPSFKDIKLIRAKLLLKMQTLGIENLINRNKQLTEELYA
jgi:RecQ family ATP-dependent DNA helicase